LQFEDFPAKPKHLFMQIAELKVIAEQLVCRLADINFCLDKFFRHLPLRKTASLNRGRSETFPRSSKKANKAA